LFEYPLVTAHTLIQEFVDVSTEPGARGFLHLPAQANGDAVLLTHGAGANCRSKLLTELSSAFSDAGFTVLQFDLPFRQSRPFGPPFPGSAQRDRDGIGRAVQLMKQKMSGRIFVGGHSYGGRQSSMLLAEEPELADGILLLSYPLHPPKKPQELRTAHFPKLTRPALFVQGTRDPFASVEEMKAALELIPGRKLLVEFEGAGHELLPKKSASTIPGEIVRRFRGFFGV
jgi:predicted alpha/beta-hydrolase family hydrolase